MPKTNIAQLPSKIYDLIEPLSPDERARVISATMILFGEESIPTGATNGAPSGQPGSPAGNTGDSPTAKSFMDEKDPKNKGETLAVAARYLELFKDQESPSKDDFKSVFTSARRDFDGNHFGRDIGNARTQARFFNTGTARGTNTLSHYGQGYVDALPDRDAASAIKKPKKGPSKKKAAKSKKKPAKK